MPELDTISISGFKSIASVDEMALRPINVLVGPNGSGKSNFIEVFQFLHAIREGRLESYVAKVGGAERLLHFGSKRTEEIAVHISFMDGRNLYKIRLRPTDADELIPHRETVYFWDKAYDRPYEEGLAGRGKEAGISRDHERGIARHVRDHLARWRLYHFHDTSTQSAMKKTQDVEDNTYLRPDGGNLASFLYLLRTKHHSSYEFIRRAVERVAPFFEDFSLEPSRLNEDKIRLGWRHKHTDAFFDASGLSDGTLRFIALATLFLQPYEYRPSVILVDEPELGLHPYAITMLASLMKQAAESTQVIVSTQSPFLLDHFEPDDVVVADRVAGATRFNRLKPEDLAVWLEDYSLGQLWEKNELGGRPASEDPNG